MIKVLDVVRDYCNEEGFEYVTDTDGKGIEIHHFQGGAHIYATGEVRSATNFRPKQSDYDIVNGGYLLLRDKVYFDESDLSPEDQILFKKALKDDHKFARIAGNVF